MLLSECVGSCANLQGGCSCYGTCCNFVMSHRDGSFVCWARRRRRCCRLFCAWQLRVRPVAQAVPASSRTWRPDCDGSWAGGVYLPLVMRSPAVGVGSSSLLNKNNTVAGANLRSLPAVPHCFFRTCYSQTIVFPPQGRDSWL